MSNYNNFLKEFYQSAWATDDIAIDINEEIFNKNKKYFNIFYKHKELFYISKDKPSQFFKGIWIKTEYKYNSGFVIKLNDFQLKNYVKGTDIMIQTPSNNIYIVNMEENRYTSIAHSHNIIYNFAPNLIDLFLILTKIRPDIFNKELLSIINEDIDFSDSLKNFYNKQKLEQILNSMETVDYEKEITELENRVGVLNTNIQDNNQSIDRLKNSNIENTRYIKESIHLMNDYYKRLKEEVKGIDSSKLDNFYNQIYSHFLIDKVNIDILNSNTLKINITTKLIPLNNFNISPFRLVEDELDVTTAKEIENIYNNNSDYKMFYSPYNIVFNYDFKDIEIRGLGLAPIVPKYQNPHARLGCYGQFESYLKDALINGDILRTINILMEYLSNTTIGDVAGNKFLSRAILQERGKEPVWATIKERFIEKTLPWQK